MNKEIYNCIVRKKSSNNLVILLLVLSVTCFLWYFIDQLMDEKYPLKEYNLLILIVGVLLLSWWYVLNKKLKRELKLMIDPEGHLLITIPLKKGAELKVNRITVIEPICGIVSIGSDFKTKHLYLKIYDENQHNTLTLHHTLTISSANPAGFLEMKEIDFISEKKGNTIYVCPDLLDVYLELERHSMIHVKTKVK